MVLSQNVSTVRMSFIRRNQFKSIPLQNHNEELKEFINNQSFSLVTLFLKFIKEDYFTYGDLSIFKSYFEENCKDHIHYLLNLQEIKKSIIDNGYISGQLVSNIKKSADKLEEMKKHKVNEESEEFKRNKEKYSFWQNQIGNYVPDLKNNLTQYDNLGQEKDLSNLDGFQAKYENIIHNFFDEKANEDELEGFDRVSSYLRRYNHAIYASIKDTNIVLETTYCHDQTQFNFLKDLDFDIQKVGIHKSFSYYYYIQEVSGNKNTYGIFVYFRFEKIHLVFYNPQTGLKEFSQHELPQFKEIFGKLIKKYGKNYCSFRLKLQLAKKKIKFKSTVNEASLITILNLSAKNYMDHIQNKKIKFKNSIQKEEYNFCQNILKNYPVNQQPITANVFFLKFSELIQKMKKNYDIINEKSFWIFFLINYLSRNDEFANYGINILDSQSEPYSGKEKIFDFILNYFNKKTTNSHIQPKKTLCLIIIEVYKQISVSDFRTPFYGNIIPFTLDKKHLEVAKLIFESFDFDFKQTLKDWNRQNLIYNERYISKRFDGDYQPLIGFSSIGKLGIKPLKSEDPTYSQLEHHFLSSTKCFDPKLTEFCLGVCNQTHVLGIGHVLKPHFTDPNSYSIEFSNHYMFVHKICPKIYDFIVVFYINEIIENMETKKLKNPIYLSYAFTLEVKKEKYLIKNFSIGYLNKTVSDKYSYEIKEKILEALKDSMTFDYYKSQGNKGKVFYTAT
jgi:hypothetical protein